jgi:hypothetical protein
MIGFFVPHYLVVTEEVISTLNTTTVHSASEADLDSDWIGEEYLNLLLFGIIIINYV